IARRIERHAFSAGTRLRHSPKQTSELAGLILYRNSQNYLELLKGKDGLQLRRHEKGHMTLIAQVPYKESEVELWVESDGEKFQFYYGQDETQRKPIGEPLSVQTLSDEVAAGFNGPFVGMYATSEGNSSKQAASFAWFEYHNR
ncbi:MAG: glycoside hydrolase family 43 protein, partial [Bacteroidia bacterium]|nr:glycoside hydrolase family 43 protein [Bacteroidia bacterium]